MKKSNNLAKNTSSMAAAVMLSRVLGLVRQQIFAFYFGASFTADAFNSAFRIANFLRRLFGEGALSAAFIPIYQKIRVENKKNEHIKFALNVISLLAISLLLISIIGIALAPLIVKIFTPGFSGETFNLTVKLTRILFPYIFFIGIASMFITILNSHNYFFIPHSASSLFNLSIIITILIYSYFTESSLVDKIIIFSLGAIIGGILQIFINIPLIKKIGYSFSLNFKTSTKEMKLLYRKFVPGAIGIGVRQINFLVDQQLASFLVVGSITALTFAWNLMMLPLSIFAITLGTAAIPNFSKLVAEEKWKNLSEQINFALASLSYVLIFITVLLFFEGKDFLQILYMRGKFDLNALNMTFSALIAYSVGLTFFGINRILSSIFFANGDTKKPMQIAIVIAVFNVILNLILMYFFQHVGLALATASCGFVQTIISWTILYKKFDKIKFNKSIIVIFKTIIWGMFWIVVSFLFKDFWNVTTFFQAFLKAAIITPLLAIIFFSGLIIFRFPYVDRLGNKFLGKLRR